MPLFHPHAIALMVPKCASSWLQVALIECAGFARIEVLRHLTLDQLNLRHTPTPVIAAIRHPVDWLSSFWHYRQRTGPPASPQAPLDDCLTDTLVDFAARYLDQPQPAIREMYAAYIRGTLTQPASSMHLLRYERLHQDLVATLDTLHIEYNATGLTQATGLRINASPRTQTLPPPLVERLIDKEGRDWIEHYWPTGAPCS